MLTYCSSSVTKWLCRKESGLPVDPRGPDCAGHGCVASRGGPANRGGGFMGTPRPFSIRRQACLSTIWRPVSRVSRGTRPISWVHRLADDLDERLPWKAFRGIHLRSCTTLHSKPSGLPLVKSQSRLIAPAPGTLRHGFKRGLPTIQLPRLPHALDLLPTDKYKPTLAR